MTKGTSDSMILSSILSTLSQIMTMGSGLHPWTPSRPHRSIHFVCLPSVWRTNLCRCQKWRITVSRTTARTTAEKQVLCHYFLCAIMNTFMRTFIHMLVYLLPNSSEKRLCFKCLYHIRNCQNNLPPTERPDLQSLLHTLDRRQRISELKPHSEDLHCDRSDRLWLSHFYHAHWSEDTQTVRNQKWRNCSYDALRIWFSPSKRWRGPGVMIR